MSLPITTTGPGGKPSGGRRIGRLIRSPRSPPPWGRIVNPGGGDGQAAPIRRHRDPDGPSRVLAEPVQQGAKRHALEMQGGNGADPTREPPLAPAQPEFAREDDDMAPDRHDLTRTDAV